VNVLSKELIDQTDFDGKYTIKVKVGEALMFSYIGMKEASVTVGAANTVNVKLVTSSQTLEEVVVVGYGTQKKKDLTSSISQLSAIQNLVTQVLKVNSPVELLEFKLQALLESRRQSQNSWSWLPYFWNRSFVYCRWCSNLFREQWFLH
jgi:hypothetical protein